MIRRTGFQSTVFVLLALGAVTFFSPGVARSDLILDQSYDETNYAATKGVYSSSETVYRDVGQSFTPSLNNIVRVDMYLSASKMYTAEDLTLGIYAADANHFPTGSALVTATLSSSSIGALAWYTFNLTQTTLTPGTEYVAWLSLPHSSVNSTGSIAVGLDNTSPTYTGGICTQDQSGTWTAYSNYDCMIRTYGVPEPATMLLLAAGGGLTLLRRKRR